MKRRQTETDEDARDANSHDDARLFVPYSDYLELRSHVEHLTESLKSLHVALVEDGTKKLGDRINTLLPILSALPPLGPTPDPVTCHGGKTNSALSDPTPNANSLNNPAACPSDPMSIALQTLQMVEKSKRAVLERLPDDANDPQQDAKDLDLVVSFARKNDLPVPSRVHRHPCKSRFRPVKLQFGSKEDRDRFITGFYQAKSSDSTFSNIPTKPRCRRDLTQPELETLRQSRKFVYDENTKAKKSIYLMKDIHYKVNPNPRPFV
uniref:Uncharacterized protein n=1 Tax=Caenorhabditis japonica TaxID=281687 RepID=A0A8R1DED5_CAEJA